LHTGPLEWLNLSPRAICPDFAHAPLGDQRRGLEDTTSGSLRRDPIAGVSTENGICVVQLAGELDLHNAQVVREALLKACAEEPQRLVVDLGEVEFIDSTALGVLIEARSRLHDRNAFVLAAPGLETKRALEISGLDRHFAVRDTVPEALEAKL
jgi:anti-sigma B factor antagonist